MFSQSVQTLFAYSKRLVVVLCMLVTWSAVYASWSSTATAYAKFVQTDNVAVGTGKVYVGTSSTPTYGNVGAEDDGSTSGSTSNSNSTYSYTFYWAASTDGVANSAFAGWYSDVNMTTLKDANATFSDNVVVTKDQNNNTASKTYFALFRKIIDAPAEVPFTKATETATTTFDVNLFSATNFRVVSSAHENGLTRTFIAEATTIASDKATITLTAGADVVDGDVFNVVLATDNGGEVTVKVKIVAKITVRFELPKRGQGYYEAIQPNNGSVETYNSQTAGESKSIELNDTKQFYQKMTAYPADGYHLYRWIITDKDGNITYPTSTTLERTCNDGDVISAEFLPNGIAQFMVKGVPDVYYYELDAAIEAAQSASSKTVVVYSSGTLYAEYKSITDGKYEFTIPSGITLLVPGDASYSMATELIKDYMVDFSGTPTMYRKLSLPTNVRINVNGHICVFALNSQSQGHNGKPKAYGQIAMGNNTEIILNSGAQLTALGYVTGDPTNSRVLAKSGSTVYEAFQFRDWRGGTQMMSGLIGNDQRVFPMGQFYVQSVETKLTIQHGATMYVSAGVSVDLKIYEMQIPLNMKLIAEDTDSDDDEGFFCLGVGAEVSKWYDGENDRQVYQIDKMQEATSATAKFGKMYADISVAGKLDSREYVMVVPNNMDVIVNDVILTNANDIALLAGASLWIGKNAVLNQQANLFVYDKEHNTGYFGASGTPLIPITYTAYHYGKYLSDKTTYSYLSSGNPYAAKNEYIRTTANLEDAKVIVDGTLNVTTKNSGLMDGSGFYTTAVGGSGTSTDDKDYGAIITSNGGGVVDFQYIGNKTITYQLKGENPVTIPITNARLRNDDGSWAAGDTLTTKEEYTYSKAKERWVTKQGMSFANWENATWLVRLPSPATVTQVVEIPLITKEELTIDNFEIEWPTSNPYFAKAGNATYDATNKKLLLPITYTLTKVHNKGVTPNAYVGEIVVKCKDLNVTGDVVATATIPLSAIEDYTPEFTVTINEVPVTTGSTYDFGQTQAQVPVVANMVITPTTGTVATLSTTQWRVVPTGAFTATQTEVTYNPQAQTTGEYDEGTLMIIATYTDAATPTPNQPADTVIVNLQGKATLQESTLAFKDELQTGAYEIYQADKITDVFSNLGNGKDITFTYTYTDGTPADDLLVASKVDGNYTLTANTTNYVDNRVVVVTATQGTNGVMNGATRTVTITIKPVVAWNWSTLYFNTERDNPVTVARAGSWTLTEQSDPNNLVTLSGTTPNYIATIGAGNAAQVYTATFKFVQGTYQKVFTSNIYADPRILSFCVDYTRQFNDVSTPTVTTVTFDENTHTATFRPGDTWEINMIGMPDKLTFTATGNNTWYIGERASASTNYSDVVAWSNLSGEQTIQLKPTTRQVIIQYGAGDNNGTITNLCISKMEISADKDVVYFPINKDGSSATKTLILTHTEPTAPTVVLDNRFATALSSVSDNLGTAENPYYQTTVTITGDKSTVEKGTYTLSATQDGQTITIPVYADEFPQGLPIKLATDDAKRYHFIAIEPDKVTWDEANRNVVFQAPEGEQTIRSVTVAFEGAPSRVSFTASQDIVDNQWRIEESENGIDFVVSGLANRDTEAGTGFVHNLQYTTRYVRIVYNSENKSEVTLSNFVIEGDPMLLVDPEELEFSDSEKEKTLTLTAINLHHIRVELSNTTDFQMSHGTEPVAASYELSSANGDYLNALGVNKVGDIVINTEWISSSIVNDGLITIYNVADNDSILAQVKLVGAGKYLRLENANQTGIYTGIPDGTTASGAYTYNGSTYTDYIYHPVDLTNAFAADGTALFDYLFVFGETTTIDGTTNITLPSGENGSNARTPYSVYIRDVDVHGNFDRYRFVTLVDNANVGIKPHVNGVTTTDSTTYINVPKETPVRVYINGFCPYASTGADKFQEGVFFFRGMAGSKLDVYLENAHIFARNKMMTGQPFYNRGDSRNPSFTEGYARGSGGVLVFECVEKTENMAMVQPFEVTIHTVGENLLKSNYGCFNYFFGMDPFQISAPIHVRLHSADHVRTSKTVVNFTDEWPTTLNADRTVKTNKRTNGFLSLQKLNNNAPSIDLGNPHTVVNFLGGQVELQNAQIVSTNYKTTLAISYRSGEYGGDKVGLKFAYGIGTDSVGGQVNFYDGTVTIQPMWVKAEYKDYYLIDKDAEGNEITKDTGKKDEYGQSILEYQTTCLRTPKNTNVYGGSICWLRACQHVTSKGGAPSDGTGKLLGQYIYEFGDGDTKDATTGLVTSIKFPGNVEGLANYYNTYHPNKTYGINSVMPDANNKLYFWIPDGFGGVTPEKDNILTTWKACMTEISAGFGTLKGTVGGPTPVEPNEEIKYMLYCKIDENISNVITAGTGDGLDRVYTYSAPVKVPPVAQGFVGGTYTSVTPSMVGMELQNEVKSDTSYVVTDKVYYVTNATADVWQTFTAPFDVEKIWVVESFSEAELIRRGQDSIQGKENANLRNAVLLEQARHNADFAAFFGVSMAIGTTDSLGTIFNDFVEWGKMEDKKDNLYNGQGDYTLRGKYPLIPYYRKADGIANFDEAHFYLNENKGNWTTEDGYQFTTQWKTLTEREVKDGVLLHKGRTYAMLFPYCTGAECTVDNRTDWDYWSGKFLIFESTDGTKTGGHTVDGANLFDSIPFATTPNVNEAIVSGNGTFSYLHTDDPNVFIYNPIPAYESFIPNVDFETGEPNNAEVMPTTAFLWTDIYSPTGAPARRVMRTGEIIYDQQEDNMGDGTMTGGNMPTVNGNNTIHITETTQGINIAVAEPQHVRVMSATGALFFNGMVQNSVDVALPTNGVYVITGENEVHKILH